MAISDVNDTSRLAHLLAESLPDLSRDTALSLALLRLLALGQAVPLAYLAAELHRTEEAVIQGIQRLTNVERDEQGRIVAAVGLSLLPTPHHFTVAGRPLYTWCALDTLMYPALLGESASISSPCPITGAPIHLQVTSTGVQQLDPPDAVISLVVPEAKAASCDIRGTFCNIVHFFTSREAAETWASQPPARQPLHILSIPEAFAVGAHITQQLYGTALQHSDA
ncbi:MAG: organomercurial lyase MerB [Ktedonobacterales bacterium]